LIREEAISLVVVVAILLLLVPLIRNYDESIVDATDRSLMLLMQREK